MTKVWPTWAAALLMIERLDTNPCAAACTGISASSTSRICRCAAFSASSGAVIQRSFPEALTRGNRR